MASGYFRCDHCGEVYVDLSPPGEPEAEASVFTAAELENASTVCDTCWQEMRVADPELDARYG